jgi:hypothetical protein
MSMVACTGTVPSDPGGGGGGGGGQGGGGGTVAPDAAEPPPVTPAVTVALTNSGGTAVTTLTSDLNVLNAMTVTLTGNSTFSGAVTLTATFADSTGTAITDWHAVFGTAAGDNVVTLTEAGTGTVNMTLEADGDVAELAGTMTITATSTTAAAVTAAVATTWNPVMDVVFTLNTDGTQGIYPSDANGNGLSYNLAVGRQIAVYNGNAATVTTALITHTNNVFAQFQHETIGGAGTASGKAYLGNANTTNTITAADVGRTDEFYWHGFDNDTTEQHCHLTAVAAPAAQ